MIYSVIIKKHYLLTATAGMISMVTFVILFFVVGPEVNQELTKVFYFDIGGIVVLLSGIVAWVINQRTSHSIN